MADSPIEKDDFEAHQTRRQFIRSVLVKTAYAAPIVATFSVANVSAKKSPSFSWMISSPMMMMMMMMSPNPMMMGGTANMPPGTPMGMGMLWS
ncbi:hypothetical protein ACFLQ0_06275 [Nitrospinota bacterium]